MNTSRIKISVFINYFLFGILLNSVGTAILQVQRYFGASESAASVLEMFKDFTIAIVSFIVASFIIRIGYKRSMLIGLAAVAAACFIVPSVKTFLAIKLLFAVTGASFALIKISVFGTIGLITKNEKEHISTMNFIESFFMVGVVSGYFIFSAFIDDSNAASDKWFTVYYYIGAVYAIAFLLLATSPLDETAAKAELPPDSKSDFSEMLKLIVVPLVLSFIVCAFLYVLIEQSIMSWLPTFNNKVLHIPSSFSIIISAIMAGSTALGRFAAGMVLKKFNWHTVLVTCLLAAAALVFIALPLANNAPHTLIAAWKDVPFAAYIFPLIGFFLAPVYPAVNSVILASLPKSKHGSMSGLIVVFSALGGTLGSIITGFIFQHYGGQAAFYFSLIPITCLIIALSIFKRIKNKQVATTA
jgi:FHS family glucose/mannose:H+ symporter-like MFS transporter